MNKKKISPPPSTPTDLSILQAPNPQERLATPTNQNLKNSTNMRSPLPAWIFEA